METDVAQKKQMITTLITQYKDRMNELQSNEVDDEALKRLEAIIRSLEAEKNLLSKRLVDANTTNLGGMHGEGGDGEGKVIEKFFHMPNTGFVWSTQELTAALK